MLVQIWKNHICHFFSYFFLILQNHWELYLILFLNEENHHLDLLLLLIQYHFVEPVNVFVYQDYLNLGTVFYTYQTF